MNETLRLNITDEGALELLSTETKWMNSFNDDNDDNDDNDFLFFITRSSHITVFIEPYVWHLNIAFIFIRWKVESFNWISKRKENQREKTRELTKIDSVFFSGRRQANGCFWNDDKKNDETYSKQRKKGGENDPISSTIDCSLFYACWVGTFKKRLPRPKPLRERKVK